MHDGSAGVPYQCIWRRRRGKFIKFAGFVTVLVTFSGPGELLLAIAVGNVDVTISDKRLSTSRSTERNLKILNLLSRSVLTYHRDLDLESRCSML